MANEASAWDEASAEPPSPPALPPGPAGSPGTRNWGREKSWGTPPDPQERAQRQRRRGTIARPVLIIAFGWFGLQAFLPSLPGLFVAGQRGTSALSSLFGLIFLGVSFRTARDWWRSRSAAAPPAAPAPVVAPPPVASTPSPALPPPPAIRPETTPVRPETSPDLGDVGTHIRPFRGL